MTLSITPEVRSSQTPAYAEQVVLSVVGLSVTFLCENEEIFHAVTETYPPASPDAPDTGIVISLKASVLPEQNLDYPPIFEVNQQIFRATSGATSLFADRGGMTGEAYICRRMLQQRYTLRHQVLNAMSYYLMSSELVTPIHCCAFVLNRKLLLCLGRSGAGKSTIAMSAHLRELPVLAEDICFLASTPTICLGYDCREIHLLPNGVEMFPALEQYPISRAHNGKIKYIVPISSGYSKTEFNQIAILSMHPNRAQENTEIVKCMPQDVLHDLYNASESGFSLSKVYRKARIDGLISNPTYTARIGSNLDDFFNAVESL